MILAVIGAVLATVLSFAPTSTAAPAVPSADACKTTSNNMPRGNCGPFRQVFAENFNGDSVPLGSFSDCNHNADRKTAYCGGLKGQYRADWWAYPNTWPDTAKSGADGNGGRSVGGTYHPEDTVSVSPASNGDGRMHIRMWRPKSGGDIHSAAVVPKKVMEQTYGKYSARFRVVKAAPGYKSAWLHYGGGCEMDFPEQNWTGTIHAFHHPCNGGPQGYKDTKQKFTDWHTMSLEWTPGSAKYFLDGKLILADKRGVSSRPLSWVLQNESALYGAYAAPGSSAQMDITWVTAYAYGGAR